VGKEKKRRTISRMRLQHGEEKYRMMGWEARDGKIPSIGNTGAMERTLEMSIFPTGCHSAWLQHDKEQM
jgi:hypothetical protein